MMCKADGLDAGFLKSHFPGQVLKPEEFFGALLVLGAAVTRLLASILPEWQQAFLRLAHTQKSYGCTLSLF